VVGYGSNCDGTHVTAPDADGMRLAMTLALRDAGCARRHRLRERARHGHRVGDIAESRGHAAVFGARTPVSSTKGHTGHTLGACGALEARSASP
jgi:3-oxoacyl-[acyl-carrier-protein] synthase II